MQDQSKTKLNTFAEDAQLGLSSKPKFLSSKYFYDETGSRLFQQIMNLPEYYLTRVEASIFSSLKKEIVATITMGNKPLDLIELGAGDGTKTAILIKYLLHQGINFSYSPVDISARALESLTMKFKEQFPDLAVISHCGDYFDVLQTLRSDPNRTKIIFFLGANIGNFSYFESLSFLNQLSALMGKNDRLLIGFDLQKDPRLILPAYSDSQGVTAAFNLNLLTRINRELGGNFDVRKFSHYAEYCPVEGKAGSFLISREKQVVFIECLKQEFVFEKNETIFMEVSQKYTMETIEQLAYQSGFKIFKNFYDDKCFFVDSLWEIVSD